MTLPINTQNNLVVPDRARPALKTVVQSSQDINTENNTTRSIEIANTENSINASINDSIVEETQEENPSEQLLDKAVEQLNSYVQNVNRSLTFNVDTNSGQTVVKVTDSETDELIRQIPNEEALRIARQLEGHIQLLNEENIEPGLLLIKLKA